MTTSCHRCSATSDSVVVSCKSAVEGPEVRVGEGEQRYQAYEGWREHSYELCHRCFLREAAPNWWESLVDMRVSYEQDEGLARSLAWLAAIGTYGLLGLICAASAALGGAGIVLAVRAATDGNWGRVALMLLLGLGFLGAGLGLPVSSIGGRIVQRRRLGRGTVKQETRWHVATIIAQEEGEGKGRRVFGYLPYKELLGVPEHQLKK